jgi:tetratricopeptide (TPR) repeat protein
MDRIVPLKGERTSEAVVVKRMLAIAVILACCGAAGELARAQAANSPGTPAQSQQKQPPAPQQTPQQPASSSQPGANANPFPEDESTVPVMPTKNSPDLPAENAKSAADRNPENWGTLFPAGDMDPVQSPDAGGESQGAQQGFSSSDSGVDSLLPPPGGDVDTDARKKHGKGVDDDIPAVHQESAAEDENVGKYYLDNKDWRAALSRYESALVLDPDNPDVYWGLAESQRHLGQFADARTNYLKVMEYDPGSRHAKDAKKALEEPELANAKPSAASNAAPAK